MNRELPFDFRLLHGTEIASHVEDLAALRIAVFREFPYLYEGSLDYERPYLSRYASSARSLIITLFHEGRLVGASSCLPLEDEMPEFRHPFECAGLRIADYFYFGESIILPAYRGKGTGREFFHLRESHAASFGTCTHTTFCAVDRDPDHPLKPEGYRPLDPFWSRLGYEKRPGLQCRLDWKEPGMDGDTSHTLTFWTKPISSQSSCAEASCTPGD